MCFNDSCFNNSATVNDYIVDVLHFLSLLFSLFTSLQASPAPNESIVHIGIVACTGTGDADDAGNGGNGNCYCLPGAILISLTISTLN